LERVLDDVRVLDLTHVWFGPFCTMLLADLGAEVVKIEPPWGERIRFSSPLVNGMNPHFLYFNRNKKGMTLNLKNEMGLSIFKDLVKVSDVVVENFTPGTMDKLGLDYETLRSVNSSIVYASLSGFGQTGPYSLRPSYDIIGQAMSGIMHLTGDSVDPGGPPIMTAEAIGDLIPGLFAAFSILTALYHRKLTGRGQRIDVAQVDCMISVVPSIIVHTMTGRGPPPVLGIYGLFRASDGYVVIGAPWGKIHDRLTEAMGLERIENQVVVEDWVGSRTVGEVVGLLVDAEVPVAPVLSIDETVQDPHVLARGMMVEVEHPQAGRVKMPNFPVKFSEMRGEIRSPAPLLGQHTEEILSTLLNYSQEDIKKFKTQQVL